MQLLSWHWDMQAHHAPSGIKPAHDQDFPSAYILEIGPSVHITRYRYVNHSWVMLPSYQPGLSSSLCRQHHIHIGYYNLYKHTVFGQGSAWHSSCSHRHVKLYATAIQVCMQAHGIEIILYHICQHCVWQGSAWRHAWGKSHTVCMQPHMWAHASSLIILSEGQLCR